MKLVKVIKLPNGTQLEEYSAPPEYGGDYFVLVDAEGNYVRMSPGVLHCLVHRA